MSGMSWPQLLKDGRSMKRESDRSLGQMAVAANTPTMLKSGLVDGDVSAGVLASGQVVGVLDDLPTCEELLDRVVTQAADQLRRTSACWPEPLTGCGRCCRARSFPGRT